MASKLSEQKRIAESRLPDDFACDSCGGSGLRLIFEHTTFPNHSPEQRHTVVETYDPNRWPWRWEEDGLCHRLYRSHQLCTCQAGKLRQDTEREESKRETKRSRQGGQ